MVDSFWKGRFNRCWLVGMFVQQTLLSIEGVKIPSVEEILHSNPEMTVADAINMRRELYGVKVDWEKRRLIVHFKGKYYDVTDLLIDIVNENSYGERVDELGMDTCGFDFCSAVKEAQKKIILKIVTGEMTPTYEVI
ncbi:MAG: hypothetical protein QXK94_02390 [Candidatus Jordarchaeales archaeon]